MKNKGVAYSGKVGKNKRIRARGASRMLVAKKAPFICQGGPMSMVTLYLQTDGATLCFILRGEVGRYIDGKWEARNV